MPRSWLQIDKCYEYLQAQAGNTITFQELLDFTGWSEGTLEINISKKIREFLEDKYLRGTPIRDRTYYVDRSILMVTKEAFRDLHRQKKWIFSKYNYERYERIRIYDFYLPLTNENLLRQNLDELFYKDTLKKRLQAINLDQLTPIYTREDDETENAYYDRLTDQASDLFWGYSISHVSGRFRTGSAILSKIEAAEKPGKAYLVDETTAVVRFIFPHEDGKEEHHEKLDRLFQILFVKAITESTPDEDEIWLLENLGSTILHKYIRDPWD